MKGTLTLQDSAQNILFSNAERKIGTQKILMRFEQYSFNFERKTHTHKQENLRKQRKQTKKKKEQKQAINKRRKRNQQKERKVTKTYTEECIVHMFRLME